MGRVQHKTNLHPKRRKCQVLVSQAADLYLHIQMVQMYLPEPASLKQCEAAAQKLQNNVATVEDLQKSNESLAKDGIEQELMQVDVKHTPVMEVVEEKKSCKTSLIDEEGWRNI